MERRPKEFWPKSYDSRSSIIALVVLGKQPFPSAGTCLILVFRRRHGARREAPIHLLARRHYAPPQRRVSKLSHAFPAQSYAETRWYACRTRAHAEKKVDELLVRAGFETYLPLIVRQRQWADRRKMVAFPLFPGYTFAQFDLTRYHDVLTTPGIVAVVRANGHPTPVRQAELESVRLLVSGVEGTGVEPDPVDFFEPGDPVRVIGGPFVGMTGVLLHGRGPVRMAVRLTSIRQALSIVLDRALLRPAE